MGRAVASEMAMINCPQNFALAFTCLMSSITPMIKKVRYEIIITGELNSEGPTHKSVRNEIINIDIPA